MRRAARPVIPVGRTYVRRAGARADGRRKREFARKRLHVWKLLRGLLEDLSFETSDIWATVFQDEADPTFAILEWVDAGWRDPWLVAQALALYGDREAAEQRMCALGRPLDSMWSYALVLELHNDAAVDIDGG